MLAPERPVDDSAFTDAFNNLAAGVARKAAAQAGVGRKAAAQAVVR
jgi:hypothetical protein